MSDSIRVDFPIVSIDIQFDTTLSESEYTPRRKVIFEKYSESKRLNNLNFLRELKSKLVRSQNYHKAGFLRDAERIIEIDYNVFEEYIYFLKDEQIYKQNV